MGAGNFSLRHDAHPHCLGRVSMPNIVRLATRGSALALNQARIAAHHIEAAFPAVRAELVTVRTTGDRNDSLPLTEPGDKSVFVREIEELVLAGRADAGVHSLKDLPSALPEGLSLAAVVERADPGEALVSRDGRPVQGLPDGARIGTSSLRRQGQLLRLRGDLRVTPIRGNVETRLRKLDSGEHDAIVLAVAGLERLGLSGRITERLTLEDLLPAAGQGAIVLETRQGGVWEPFLREVDDAEARLAVEAERAFVRAVGADCHSAAACLCTFEGVHATVRARICSPDGRMSVDTQVRGAKSGAVELGNSAAAALLEAGAAEILARGARQ
jgi:hydroxymethylbilane synthase